MTEPMTTLDLMTLIAAFLWGLVSAAIGAWAMARAQRRRQPPPVLPGPKPITTTEALKLAANFLAAQKPAPGEPYSKFFARTAEEAGVLPPSRAADSPTPPTEGETTQDPPGAALRATGLSVEEERADVTTRHRDETPPQGPSKPVTKPPEWQDLDGPPTSQPTTLARDHNE